MTDPHGKSERSLPDQQQLTRIIQAAQAGDGQAREHVFGEYRSRLMRILALRMGRKVRDLDPDVEDIVQDSLLEACRDLETVNPQTSGELMSWLTTITMNNMRDRRRWQRVREMVEPLRTTLLGSLGDDLAQGPEQAAYVSELESATDAAMLELDESERELLILRVYQELSAKEIAAALGLKTPEAARSRILRARRQLDQHIQRILAL